MAAGLDRKTKNQIAKLKSIQQKHFTELRARIAKEIMATYTAWTHTQKSVATYLWTGLKQSIARITLKSVMSLTSALGDNIPKIFGYQISPERQAVVTEQLVTVYRSKVAGFANDTADGVRKMIDATFKEAQAKKLTSEATMQLVKDRFKQASDVKSNLGAHLMTSEITAKGSHDFAKEANQKSKTWIYTYVAKKPRAHHQALAGTTIGINESFQVGGYTALYPHDNKLPIGERANCHCSIAYSS